MKRLTAPALAAAALTTVLAGFLIGRQLSHRPRPTAETAAPEIPSDGSPAASITGRHQQLHQVVSRLALASPDAPPAGVDLSRMTELDRIALRHRSEVAGLRTVARHLLSRVVKARFRCLDKTRTEDVELRYAYQLSSAPQEVVVSDLRISVLNGSPLAPQEQECLDRASAGNRRMSRDEAAAAVGLPWNLELPSGVFEEHVDVSVRGGDLALPGGTR